MSRRRLGRPALLTAVMAGLVSAPVAAGAQPVMYRAPAQPQQTCEEKGGHPTIGMVAGGLAGAALGASLGLQIGAMLGGEIGGRVGRTKCKPQARNGPAYPVYPQGYAAGAYPQAYAYPPQAYYPQAYPQAAYPPAAYAAPAYAQQPAYAAPAASPQVAPPPGYAARSYGVWPYGDVYVTPAKGPRRGS